jgi:hypothetical protein
VVAEVVDKLFTQVVLELKVVVEVEPVVIVHQVLAQVHFKDQIKV